MQAHSEAPSEEDESLDALEESIPDVLVSLCLASCLKQFLHLALKCSADGSTSPWLYIS